MSKLLLHYQKVSNEELRTIESNKLAQPQANQRKTRYSVARVSLLGVETSHTHVRL
jgi:hypothetical protein